LGKVIKVDWAFVKPIQ